MTLSHAMVGPKLGLDAEHLEGHPVEAGDRRVEHRQAVERQHAGHPAEQARAVGRDDGERSPSPREHVTARPQQLDVLGGGEVVAHLVRGATAQDVGRASHEVADEVRLPRAPTPPDRWPGCRPR